MNRRTSGMWKQAGAVLGTILLLSVPVGPALLGNPGGAHAGELHLAGLTGQVSITLTATGALASTATWPGQRVAACRA